MIEYVTAVSFGIAAVAGAYAWHSEFMAGEGGSVNDKTLPEVLDGVRALLRAIDEGRMSCSAAYRNRLQGTVVALEALNSRSMEPSTADMGTSYPLRDTPAS